MVVPIVLIKCVRALIRPRERPPIDEKPVSPVGGPRARVVYVKFNIGRTTVGFLFFTFIFVFSCFLRPVEPPPTVRRRTVRLLSAVVVAAAPLSS